MILDLGDKLVIDYRARDWCKLPYPDHPKGCPNYGTRSTCPPDVSLVENAFDMSAKLWFVVTSFDLRGHIEKMKGLHPHWSYRQARCVLYWQGSVNKRLKQLCQLAIAMHPNTIYSLCPEAMGVDVIHTGRKLGLPIKPRPQDTVFKIALLGYDIKEE